MGHAEPRLRSSLSSRRGFAFALAGLCAALAFAVGFRLASDPVGRTSEQRCIEVVRRMVESGDFLVPRLAEGVRLRCIDHIECSL